jgi:hypothetical protein
MHCQLIQASECWLAMMNPMRTGDEGRNYILHFFICQHRHPAALEVTYGKTPATAQPTKPTVEKTRNRAGATPLFRLSAAQVNRGVAPARPEQLGAVFCPPTAEKQEFCQATSQTIRNHKRRKQLPILKVPPKQAKNESLQLRVSTEFKLNLQHYSEFLGATPSYVVIEALNRVFEKDRDFKTWLEQRTDTVDEPPTETTFVTEISKRP